MRRRKPVARKVRKRSIPAAAVPCRISVTTTTKVKDALEKLVSFGLSGGSISEAAERLICQGLLGEMRKSRQKLFT